MTPLFAKPPLFGMSEIMPLTRSPWFAVLLLKIKELECGPERSWMQGSGEG